jgi:response regulator RpfG family c-di-GMP phosphodiesterase
MKSRVDYLCISSDAKVRERSKQLSEDFKYVHDVTELSKVASWKDSFDQVEFILMDLRDVQSEQALTFIKAAIKLFEKSFICPLISDKEKSMCADYKAAGAQLVLMEQDFFNCSYIEFISSQVVRASYVPVKISDFTANSILDFHLYHLMPLNKKLVVVLPRGTALSQERIKKMENIGDVFVRREEMSHYREYFETKAAALVEQSSQRKCRALYITYCLAHTQLVFSILDGDEATAGKEGKWLYNRCEILAESLLKTMSMVGEAWDVVDSSAVGEFGSVERAPAVSAYAGLLSLSSSLGEPMDVMMGALLSDVGLLKLNPGITAKIRKEQGVKHLTESEKAEFHKQVFYSRQMLLNKKLPVKETLMEIISTSHERADGRGFPESRKDQDIPVGSYLIQFCEKIDSESTIKMGRIRVPVTQVRKNILEEEMKNPQAFPADFLKKLKPVL